MQVNLSQLDMPRLLAHSFRQTETELRSDSAKFIGIQCIKLNLLNSVPIPSFNIMQYSSTL